MGQPFLFDTILLPYKYRILNQFSKLYKQDDA